MPDVGFLPALNEGETICDGYKSTNELLALKDTLQDYIGRSIYAKTNSTRSARLFSVDYFTFERSGYTFNGSLLYRDRPCFGILQRYLSLAYMPKMGSMLAR